MCQKQNNLNDGHKSGDSGSSSHIRLDSLSCQNGICSLTDLRRFWHAQNFGYNRWAALDAADLHALLMHKSIGGSKVEK
jgi:hypothetical protein